MRLIILFIYLFNLLLLIGCSEKETNFLSEFTEIDHIIVNGQVIDGTGQPGFNADIVIVDDEIVFIGDTSFSKQDYDTRVMNVIDANGKVVTPGFIDLHAHGNPLQNNQLENFLAMGVTTITLGQDGASPNYNPLSDWLDQIINKGIGTNLAMFVGHGTLRNLSGIGLSDSPSKDDLQKISKILNETLEYTFGLSTGLEYNPGLHAKPDELNQLARIVGNHDRLIMSHMRNEDDDQLEASISELLDQGQFARVHISHLKAVYGSGAERANEILGILRDARNLGVKITADIYPYNASYTGIGIIFPNWAKTEKQFEFAKLNRRDELAIYLKNRVNRRNGPEATLLGTEPFLGITLAELAHKREASFEDVLIDEIGPNGASGAYFVMNDELQSQLLTDSYIGICSDGSSNGFHPRGHGTFAKIIERYVLQEKILTLEEAIRKMTSFAASVLAITDRGMLKIGQKADILVFEPKNIKALATYPNPFQLAQGFDIVLVNGEIARKYNHLTGKLSGQVLIP